MASHRNLLVYSRWNEILLLVFDLHSLQLSGEIFRDAFQRQGSGVLPRSISEDLRNSSRESPLSPLPHAERKRAPDALADRA